MAARWLPALPAGLRWRLAGAVAAVMIACTAVAFLAVYRGTGIELRHQIDQELRGDARELLANLAEAGGASPATLASAASRYVRDQPFKASSTLLFVQVQGEPTSTNRPELFSSRPPDRGETAARQAVEDRVAGRLLAAPAGYSTVAVADVGDLRLLKLPLAQVKGPAVMVGVGEPLAAVSRGQHGVARALLLAGLIALAGTLLGALLVGARLSRPLRRMAAVAARVDAGDLHPRIHHEGGAAEEVRVLADAFNRMLDRLTAAFASQRAFVADASHELRTPLTVMRGQLEVLAAQRDPPGEEVRRVAALVQAEIARVSRLVEDLLLLAKSEQTEFLRVELLDLRPFVQQLWDGMSLLAERRFERSAVPAGTLRADPDRLAQALRNLLNNAIEHTRAPDGVVRMRVEAAGTRVRFLVEDDGPGIPGEHRELVFHRFHRVDASRSRAAGGTGLGLAIVRAIADAHGGAVRAGSSPEGGSRFLLELPGFDADRRPRPAGTAVAAAHSGGAASPPLPADGGRGTAEAAAGQAGRAPANPSPS